MSGIWQTSGLGILGEGWGNVLDIAFVGSKPTSRTNIGNTMAPKETIDKAYGSIPKEVGMSNNSFDWLPEFRGLRYYWYKLIRKVTR